jgi:hypothetical protein
MINQASSLSPKMLKEWLLISTFWKTTHMAYLIHLSGNRRISACHTVPIYFGKVVFTGIVPLAEEVRFAGAVKFPVGAGNALLPKFNMVVLLVRLNTYFPSDGVVSDHPFSRFSTTVYSPGTSE